MGGREDITESGNECGNVVSPPYFCDDEDDWSPTLWVAPAVASHLRLGAGQARGPTGLRAARAEWVAKRRQERALESARASDSDEEEEDDFLDEIPDKLVLQPGIDFDEVCDPCLPRRWRTKYEWTPLSGCKMLQGRIILTDERLQALRPNLPMVCRLAGAWKLVYSPRVHGVSLGTFYRQCQAWPGETLILAEDTYGKIFGAFATHTWRRRHDASSPHYGVPECFVFTFGDPAEEDCGLTLYPWSGKNMCFMHADRYGFSMGEAPTYAFWISEDFLRGTSDSSQTFGNEQPLASDRDFVLRRFECWTFADSASQAAPSPSAPPAAGGKNSGAECSVSEETEDGRRRFMRSLQQQAVDHRVFGAF